MPSIIRGALQNAYEFIEQQSFLTRSLPFYLKILAYQR